MPKESVFFNISTFKLIKTEEQGVVSLYKRKGYELDRDNKLIGNKIVLLVKVEDQCSDIYQRLSSTKQITIHLIDLNDNPPMIVNDEQMSAIKIIMLVKEEEKKRKEGVATRFLKTMTSIALSLMMSMIPTHVLAQ